ncbi:MAG: YbaK/EbsC family protein [Candidatus Rokubacteria bacterium]|nr:YbaK/EbsC family protein [Candidatus Rokubacteria bacterium]
MNPSLKEFLASRGAAYEVVAHPDAFTAQEQAAVSHISGRSWAKVVLVKERDGYAMAVLPACCTVDLNRLKGLIGHGPIRLASLEEILGVISDSEPGAIAPFGGRYGLPVLLDRELVRQREIAMPAGDHHTAIRMRAAEFLRLAAPRVGDFAVHEKEKP